MYTEVMDEIDFVPLEVKEAYCAAQSAKERKRILDGLDCRALIEEALENARTDDGKCVGICDDQLHFKSKKEQEEFSRAMTEPG